MNLFVLSLIPQYITSPFWFVLIFAVLYFLAKYMYKREFNAIGSDNKNHDAKAGGWAIIESFSLFLGVASALWLVTAVVVYFISSA
ncbi:MAG: hypothetical protein LiPW41_366 [Parcubacteria group bacterium LiPW_41]|nr:MAG: hypothetical protein LiPW41_366 [Parcubacteria group bacterium LiPW_41]